MIPERGDRHPFLLIKLSLFAAVLVPVLIASACGFGFISAKAALLLGGLVVAAYGATIMWLVLSGRLTFYSAIAKKK